MLRRPILIIVLVLLAGSWAFPPRSAARPTPAGETVVLQLPWPYQFSAAGFVAAAEKGFYAREGLNVVIREGLPGRPVSQVMAGHAQYGVSTSALLYYRVTGKPLVVVAPLFQKSPFVIVSLRESGITKPHDLAGRRIMTGTPETSAEALAMLHNEGISPVLVRRIPRPGTIDDLTSGRADAIVACQVNELPAIDRERSRFNIITPGHYGIDFYGNVIFTSHQELKEHPERVAAFRRASIAGWEYALNHPDELIERLVRRASTERGRDRAYLARQAMIIKQLTLHDIVELGHNNPDRWRHIGDTYASLGMISPDHSLTGFLYDPNPPRFSWNHWGVRLAASICVLVLSAALVMLVTNKRLAREVGERRRAEDELARYRNHLEELVEERTNALMEKSEELVNAISERRQIKAKLLQNEKRLTRLSQYDPLTGLPNRLLLRDRLEHAIERSSRSGKTVALLFMDLDRFKKINETLGHEAGDRLLREMARRLKSFVRRSDTLGRFGGDEFILVLEQIEDFRFIAVMARKTLESLAAETQLDGQQLFVTASIGISVYPVDGSDAETLLKCADTAMYRAKGLGGNCYQLYEHRMNARAHELLVMESSLHKSLRAGELRLFYQPQVDLATGELIGMEALLRWQHPTRGLVLPGEIIPIAEDCGLIVPIGEWVLRTACRQLKELQQHCGTAVPVAVNVSSRQFVKTDLVDTIARTLHETGLPPRLLEIEITESMIMHDLDAALAILSELRRMGVRIAIDDFGTGYSSLSHLKHLPISRLKIDRSFVRDVATNANDAAITGAVIFLARTMGLEVIAEGVENAAQLDFLMRNGCILGQGYLFSPPLPVDELVTFIHGRCDSAATALAVLQAFADGRLAASNEEWDGQG